MFGGEQFLKCCCFCFFFSEIFINIDRRERGRQACVVLVLREAACEVICHEPPQILNFLTRIVVVRVKLPQGNCLITSLLQFRFRMNLTKGQ